MSHAFQRQKLSPGQRRPFRDGGVNFSLFSRIGFGGVELLLFDRDDDAHPSRSLRLNPVDNRTYHYWHVFVPGVRAGQIYGYRVEGPSAPELGLRFDPSKVLLSTPTAGAWSLPKAVRP